MHQIPGSVPTATQKGGDWTHSWFSKTSSQGERIKKWRPGMPQLTCEFHNSSTDLLGGLTFSLQGTHQAWSQVLWSLVTYSCPVFSIQPYLWSFWRHHSTTCLSRGNICSLLGTGYFNTRKNIKIAGQKQQSHLHRAGLTWFGLQSQPAKHRQSDKGSFFKGYLISSESLAHCWK